MDNYLRHAADMMGCDPVSLPLDLVVRLDLISGLCDNAGGTLISRQVVAVVVEQWNREEKNMSDDKGRTCKCPGCGYEIHCPSKDGAECDRCGWEELVDRRDG